MRLKRYIDEETGEILNVTEYTKECNNDTDFKKAWFGRILFEAESLMNNNMKLLMWLSDEADKQNRIFGNYQIISEKSGIPLVSVKRAMKQLIEHNIILKVQTGMYMFNPSLIASVNSEIRGALVVRYKVKQNEARNS